MTGLPDFAPGRDKIKFIKNNVPYYYPNLFHAAKTQNYTKDSGYIPMLIRDIMSCTTCRDVYAAEGFSLDTSGFCMLGNHPIKNIRIRGKVIAESVNEYAGGKVFYFIYINDGSYGDQLLVKVPKKVYLSESLYFMHNTHLIIEFRGNLNFFNGFKEFNVESLVILGEREDLDLEVDWIRECLHYRNKVLCKPWVFNENDVIATNDLEVGYRDDSKDNEVTMDKMTVHSRISIMKAKIKDTKSESNEEVTNRLEDSIYFNKTKESSPAKSTEETSPLKEFVNTTSDIKTESQTNNGVPRRKFFGKPMEHQNIKKQKTSESINKKLDETLVVMRNANNEITNSLVPIITKTKLYIEILKICISDPSHDLIPSLDLYQNPKIQNILNQYVMCILFNETIKRDGKTNEILIDDGTFATLSKLFKSQSISKRRKDIFISCILELSKINIIAATRDYEISTSNIKAISDYLVGRIRESMASQETAIKKILREAVSLKLGITGLKNYLSKTFQEIGEKRLDFPKVLAIITPKEQLPQELDNSLINAWISWIIFETDMITKGGFTYRVYNLDKATSVSISWKLINNLNSPPHWVYRPDIGVR